MSAPARWTVEDGVPADSRTGVQLRVGFPAGAYDPAVARRVAEYVATVLNDHDADRRMRRWLLHLLAKAAWPAAAAAVTAAVFAPALAAGLALVAAGALAGSVACLAALRGRGLDVEAMATRKDLAIDAALDNAFEIERISGETPAVPLYDQLADSGVLCTWCPQDATTTVRYLGQDNLPACQAHAAEAAEVDEEVRR